LPPGRRFPLQPSPQSLLLSWAGAVPFSSFHSQNRSHTMLSPMADSYVPIRTKPSYVVLHPGTIEKTFTDAVIGLKEVVVLDGIDILSDQSGISVRVPKARNSCNRLIYKNDIISPILGFFGYCRVFTGKVQERLISYFLSYYDRENTSVKAIPRTTFPLGFRISGPN
jgi:hypothetical protein